MDVYLREFEKLNEYQKEAVVNTDKYVLLNAAVGSGKTTVLVHKVLYLHLIKKIPLDRIMVLTFTNRAANEMKSRIIDFMDSISCELKYFGTFHSVARLLSNESRHLDEIGYKKDFGVIDNEEAGKILSEIIDKGKLKIKYKAKLSKRIEEFKSGKPLYGVMKKIDDIDELVGLYKEEKLKRNVMDFDDIIENCIKLLKEPLDIDWIIVDEFQDTDTRQFQLIKKAAGDSSNLFCIGDPNQIIYSWRTGAENIFEEYKRSFDPKEVSLPLNYRSTQTIIEAANSFLYGTAVKGTKDYGSPIKILKHHDAFNEALYIAREAARLNELGVPYNQMAVLYRRQAQLEVLLDVLKKENIPGNILFKNSLPYEDHVPFENNACGINLLTLHASKGLEFSHVFIIGANMGNIPLSAKKSDEPEELRLFYVGITRAKSHLEISYLSNPGIIGATSYKSPYISMIPTKLLDIEEECRAGSLKGLMDLIRQEREKKASSLKRKAKHGKYGTGEIIYEDEDTIRVRFESYGEKEFSKMFCPIEIFEENA